jgi:arylsulfatase A-like enzyme
MPRQNVSSKLSSFKSEFDFFHYHFRTFLLNSLMKTLLLGALCCATCLFATPAQAKAPNILWIVAEDLSPWFGAYGDEVNAGHTPDVDKLAEEGVLFTRAYATSPVCSASRSALITGVMQTTTGTHQHRSSRTTNGEVVPEGLRIHLPEGMKTIPELMKAHGYFTFSNNKDDYNFHYNRLELYDIGTKDDYQPGMNGWQGNQPRKRNSFEEDVWDARPDKDQPWFGQIQVDGGKGDKRYLDPSQMLEDPQSIDLPPYFPDTPALREAWTVHYDHARGTSERVGQILAELEADGELENTIVFFFSDHGHNTSLRHKQFCYEGGLHVPLIIKGEHPAIPAGTVVDDMVSLLDLGATTLGLAGVPLPDYLDGQDVFGADYTPATYQIAARDRCDYTIDRIRSVRSDQYRYIRNYFFDRPILQPGYRDDRPPSMDLRRLQAEGALTPYQAEFWLGKRPPEELYDLASDPYQINNLARRPEYREILFEHRHVLENWTKETGDQGQVPEDLAQLEATYILWKDLPIFKNAEVNPEYDQFR